MPRDHDDDFAACGCYARAMTSGQSLESLRGIGWQGARPTGPVARVVAQHRAGYELHDGERVFAAQPCGEFLRPGLEPERRPAVGDFVCWKAGQPAEIEAIVPRRSALVRAAAGERYKRQIIAANIDAVLVLTGLDGDFNPGRIERYLALVAGAGIQPVVVLTKADQGHDAAPRLAGLRQRLPDAVPVLALNAKSPEAAELLAPWLQAGASVVLVGSSGAGKSTLTNTLLGEARMQTGAVRGSDSRGRHTTTHRALLKLPGGACLIDTPGMRELKLTGTEELDSFADIEALALTCRFGDCAHHGEPGCAVRAAVEAGSLDAARVRNYAKLAAERGAQADREQARRQRKLDSRQAVRRKGRERGDEWQ